MSCKGQIQPLNLDFEPKEKKDCGCHCNGNKDSSTNNVNISNYSNKSGNLMRNGITLPHNESPPILPPQLNSNNNSKYIYIAIGLILLYSMKS
jgi:hypothetical protein